jgi:hypothetical protein
LSGGGSGSWWCLGGGGGGDWSWSTNNWTGLVDWLVDWLLYDWSLNDWLLNDWRNWLTHDWLLDLDWCLWAEDEFLTDWNTFCFGSGTFNGIWIGESQQNGHFIGHLLSGNGSGILSGWNGWLTWLLNCLNGCVNDDCCWLRSL